ncbi:MAG: OsmC family protein [bacterium]|nr:OsmC family protein [bacterium]
MATSNIIYLNELRTNAIHLASQNQIVTDAPKDNHGKGEAFSPTDLAATSLGACLLTVMGIYAQNNGIDMTDTSAEVTKIMNTEGSRRIVGIDVNVTFITKEPLSDKLKTIFKNIADTCPVAKSLHPDIVQKIVFEFKTL